MQPCLHVTPHMKAATLVLLTLAAGDFAAASRITPTRTDRVRMVEGVADIVERTLPSVVRVTVQAKSESRKAAGEASGVCIAPDGYILTNHHVVEGAAAIRVQWSDEREMSAVLIASDAQTDLAVLKVQASGLPYMEFGDSAKLRVGDAVLAIGNPFGIGVTVTSGIVSARGRTSPARQFEDYIQTDAAINPGNSGGPLVSGQGELIGINTAILSPSGGSNGIGFAIPSNVARTVMSDLIVHGRVLRGYLGLGLQPMNASLADALGVETNGGALISDVAPGSPAAKAGLEKGTVLIAIDDQAVGNFDRLRMYIARSKPGASIRLRVASPAGERAVSLTLADRPEGQSIASEEQLPGGAVVSVASLPAGSSGVLMLAIDPEGQFAAAGLRAGDVIAGVNRKPVGSVAELKREIGTSEKRNVLVEVNRAGSSYYFAVERASF